jgi:hypothetical protein
MLISAAKEEKKWQIKQAKKLKEARIRVTASEVLVTAVSSLA